MTVIIPEGEGPDETEEAAHAAAVSEGAAEVRQEQAAEAAAAGREAAPGRGA